MMKMVGIFSAKAAARDFAELRDIAGRDWTDLPAKLRSLIEATVLNAECRSDALLLLTDALAEMAEELACPRMAEHLTRVTDCLRGFARRRA